MELRMERWHFSFPHHEDIDRPNEPNEPQSVTPPVVDEFYKFEDSSHPAHILVGLHNQWREDHFLDVTIKVNDVSVRAHRSVLSAFSGYFKTLFNNDISDAGRDEISLLDIHVSGTAIQLLIEFAYCGTLNITPDNIQDLLSAANFLCIDTVIGACCTYLQSNLSIDNCVDVLELAVALDKVELQQNTKLFMMSHFEEIVQEEIFLQLSVEQLLGLLEEDELTLLENGFCGCKVEQEEKILKVVMRFVEAKPEVNHEHLPMLLSRGVRLMLLPLSVLESLKSSNWITSSPECLKLLNRITSSDVSSDEQKFWKQPRLCMVQYEKTQELAAASHFPSEAFDDVDLVQDGHHIFVTGMKVYTRMWYDLHVVGGIEVFYNTGLHVLHGTAGYGYEDSEFHLGFGERIISITVRAGWMIDRLVFTSNHGNVYGPFGGDGGDEYDLPSPCTGACLAYITGTVDATEQENAIRHLSFAWGFHKLSLRPKRCRRSRLSGPSESVGLERCITMMT